MQENVTVPGAIRILWLCMTCVCACSALADGTQPPTARAGEVTLGRALFNDPLLSFDGTMACVRICRRAGAPRRVEVAEVGHSGNLAWLVGNFPVDYPTDGGKTATATGNYVSVYRKEADGVWRTVLDTWNDTPSK